MKFLFDTSKMTKKVEEMNEALKKIRERYQSEAQGLFNELTNGFFRAYPQVKSIYWTQYTPHWNDGEDCEFSVNEIYYKLDRDYDGSKFAGAEDTTSDWDPRDPEDEDELEDDFDEDDYEDGQFSHKSSSEIQKEIDRYKALLGQLVIPQYTNQTSYAFDYKNNGYGYGQPGNYVFSESKCRSHIQNLEQELSDVQKENEQFPNRDEIIAAIDQVKKFINGVDSDLMQDIFGDHVKVVLTKDGVHTFEYEHE